MKITFFVLLFSQLLFAKYSCCNIVQFRKFVFWKIERYFKCMKRNGISIPLYVITLGPRETYNIKHEIVISESIRYLYM